MKPVDIAVVCALHTPELEKLKETNNRDWKMVPPDPDDPTTYHFADFTTVRGTCVRVLAASPNHMGPTSTAVLTAKMILRFRPKLVAMVGIAAGARSNEQNFGDILAADTTFAHDSGKKVDKNGRVEFKPDPQPLAANARLVSRLKDWAANSHSRYFEEIRIKFENPPARTVKLHVGPIASGGFVVDSLKSVNDIASRWRKLVGLEMEAYSAHRACHDAAQPDTPFLCLKSVCDFATKKNDDWQRYAAYTAAQFFEVFIANEWENLNLRDPISMATRNDSDGVSVPLLPVAESANRQSLTIAKRLVELLRDEQTDILVKVLRTTVPHKVAQEVRSILSNHTDIDKERMRELLESIYNKYLKDNSIDAEYIRQNCCYYMCFFRTGLASRFLLNTLQSESSLLVKRGIYLGLITSERNVEMLREYLRRLRSSERVASINGGYYQCYYGDKFFPEGHFFDPALSTEASVAAIFRHIHNTEMRPFLAIDLFTVRYFIVRSSTRVLTSEQLATLKAMINSSGEFNDETQTELRALSDVLADIISINTGSGIDDEYLIVEKHYAKRLVPSASLRNIGARYATTIYMDGKFFSASGVKYEEFASEIESDTNKADRLVNLLMKVDRISTLKQNSILELGCSYGAFLKCWHDRTGAESIGVDLSQHSINFGQSVFPKVQLQHGDASDIQFLSLVKNASIVCMFDFLEHCFDVSLLLSDISHFSREGTLVVIYLPTVDSITRSLEAVTKNNKYLYDEHLYYFTESGIVEEMKRHRFRLVHSEYLKTQKLLTVFERV
jgi:nucleoside phosphorylase